MNDYPTTNGGRLLARGDSFDIECSRTTHRLRVGQGILRSLGFTPTFPDHAASCMNHPDNALRRCFGISYPCLGDCPRRNDPAPTWDETATGKVFDAAYALACAVQDGRGAAASRAINAERAARRAG